jgi:tRNA A-37 threonylcarbamoyl transferase component Bud32
MAKTGYACSRCKTPYPQGIPAGGQCFNCGARDFRSLPKIGAQQPQKLRKRTTGFLSSAAANAAAKKPLMDNMLRSPRKESPPAATNPKRQEAPRIDARPRPPTRRGAAARPVAIPPFRQEPRAVDAYDPRAVDAYEAQPLNEAPAKNIQAAPAAMPPPASDRFPMMRPRPPAPPEPLLLAQNFSSGPLKSPYLEFAKEIEAPQSESVIPAAPSIFQDAASEAADFQKTIADQLDEGDDTSTALQQVSASPLVWSPGSSTQSEYISKRYLIRNPRQDLLGTGAKGVVYKAYDTKLGGRKVALKLFFDAFGDMTDPEIIEEEKNRTQREIEIQGELTHPSIVTIHDRFDSEHGSGVVLEFVDGETLEDRIEALKIIAVGDAVRITIELTKAVEFMHLHQFIHRDIKPGNVLITRDENVKLIDFGLSKSKNEKEKNVKEEGVVTRRLKLADNSVYKTHEGDIIGTPAYMAPEQASGRLKDINETSDVYGLGAILYHCLTGAPPINKETIEEVLDLVVAGSIPSPRGLNSAVDPALESIVMKSLARDQEDRFQTALSLREQLILYQDKQPLDSAVYEEPFVQRATRWLISHQTFAIVLITILASVGTLIGGIKLYQNETARLQGKRLIEDARMKASMWSLDEAFQSCEQIIKIEPENGEVYKILTDINRNRPIKDTYYKALKDFKIAKRAFKNNDKTMADTMYFSALMNFLDYKKLRLTTKRTASEIKFSPLVDDKRLTTMIEEAKGLITFALASPNSEKILVKTSVQLQRFENQNLEVTAGQFVDFKSPTKLTKKPNGLPTPIRSQRLSLGTYLVKLEYGKRKHLFPIKVERNQPLNIGAIPVPPRGFVYIFARKAFRPGHPRHDNLAAVDMAPFFIQEKEVSIRDYLNFLRDSEKWRGNVETRQYKPFHWITLKAPLPPKQWDRPIRNISQRSAKAYNAWISKKTGLTYSLPTEAQWQLAASGGYDDRDYPYGRRYHKEWSITSAQTPSLTGSKARDISPFGVLDMGGNVKEWVQSPIDFDDKTFLAKGGSYKGPAPLWRRTVHKENSDIRNIGFRSVLQAPAIKPPEPN